MAEDLNEWPRLFSILLLSEHSLSLLLVSLMTIGLFRHILSVKERGQQVKIIIPYLTLWNGTIILYHISNIIDGAIYLAYSEGLDRFPLYELSDKYMPRDIRKWFAILHLATTEGLFTGVFATVLIGYIGMRPEMNAFRVIQAMLHPIYQWFIAASILYIVPIIVFITLVAQYDQLEQYVYTGYVHSNINPKRLDWIIGLTCLHALYLTAYVVFSAFNAIKYIEMKKSTRFRVSPARGHIIFRCLVCCIISGALGAWFMIRYLIAALGSGMPAHDPILLVCCSGIIGAFICLLFGTIKDVAKNTPLVGLFLLKLNSLIGSAIKSSSNRTESIHARASVPKPSERNSFVNHSSVTQDSDM